MTLAEGLLARGHEVVFFCRPGSPLHERVGAMGLPSVPVVSGADANPRALAGAWLGLRRHAPEVVIVQKEKDVRVTAVAARLRGIPVVIRHETDRPLKRLPHYAFFYGWTATHHVVNSLASRDTLLASAPWVRPERVTLIPNGIDAAAFAAAVPACLGLPADALTVGFLGQLEPRKGVLDLAAAWPLVSRAVPNAHLVIAGRGPLEPEQRRVLASEPRVTWLGFRSDVAQVLAALDLVVVPSHFEGFSLAAVEAMAAGRPVVASRVSSLPELVREGVEGRLVAARSPEALASAIIDLLGSPRARVRMGRAGALRALDFTIGRMLDGHEALLAALTGRSAAARL